MANCISLWFLTLISFIRICKLFFFFIPFFFFFYYTIRTFLRICNERHPSGKGRVIKRTYWKEQYCIYRGTCFTLKLVPTWWFRSTYSCLSLTSFCLSLPLCHFLSVTFCLLLSLFFSFPPFISVFSSPILSSIFISFTIWFYLFSSPFISTSFSMPFSSFLFFFLSYCILLHSFFVLFQVLKFAHIAWFSKYYYHSHYFLQLLPLQGIAARKNKSNGSVRRTWKSYERTQMEKIRRYFRFFLSKQNFLLSYSLREKKDWIFFFFLCKLSCP